MRKLQVLLGVAALAGAAFASDVAARQTTQVAVAQSQAVTAYAPHLVLDVATGQIRQGRANLRGAATVYDNTQLPTAVGTSAAIGVELGDDLSMAGGGLLSGLTFSIFNSGASGGQLDSADVTFNFYDRANDAKINDPNLTPTPFATFTQNIDLSANPLQPGFAVLVDLTGLDSLNITLPIWTLLTQTFSNVQGGATDLGVSIYHGGFATPYPTMDQGESGDHFLRHDPVAQTWGYYYFSTNPWADFGYMVVVAEVSPAVLWDTGCPHTLLDPNGVETYLGFTSGNVTGSAQRWAAIPFSIAADTVIDQINFNWFEAQPGSQNVKYIIWRRSGLTKPTSNANIFRQGNLGTYVLAGQFDRRIHLLDDVTFHEYRNLNIAITAGDYYLTLYSGDPNDGNQHALAWLTGGMLQPDALEQQPDPNSFMWRAANFPSPGFAQYTVPHTPGLEMQTDPGQYGDMYNVSFQLVGRGGVAVCRGDANCDGSVNFNDINPFVLALSNFAGWQAAFPNCPTGNVDVNGDGSVNFNDINPFVTLLSGGGGSCH